MTRIDWKYKEITRGPRKGQWRRKTRVELIREREASAKIVLVEGATAQISPPVQQKAIQSVVRDVAGNTLAAVQFLGFIAILAGVVWLSVFIWELCAKGLNAIGLGKLTFPLVWLDFFLYKLMKKPQRYSKYLPFLWWL